MGERFLANVGTALLFRGDQFVGIADTLTENTFAFEATPNEVRGGKSNPLLGRWFSDSTMNVTLINATFKLEYLAWTLGASIEQGGPAIYESAASGEKIVTPGSIALTKKPVSFNGTMIGWYKKAGTDNWIVGNITNGGDSYSMTIPEAKAEEVYCIKYQYFDENARFMPIPADFNPDELHVIIINDEYNADINTNSGASVVGRLITDISRLGLDPSQTLTLNATSSAPTQLSGTAFRLAQNNACGSEAIYGSMTEQVFDSKWQDNAVAIAVENGDVEIAQQASEVLNVRVIYSGSVLPSRQDNSNFTFAVENSPASTATGTSVDVTGKVTAGSTPGTAVISVTLKDAPHVEPAFVVVTVE